MNANKFSIRQHHSPYKGCCDNLCTYEQSDTNHNAQCWKAIGDPQMQVPAPPTEEKMYAIKQIKLCAEYQHKISWTLCR